MKQNVFVRSLFYVQFYLAKISDNDYKAIIIGRASQASDILFFRDSKIVCAFVCAFEYERVPAVVTLWLQSINVATEHLDRFKRKFAFTFFGVKGLVF